MAKIEAILGYDFIGEAQLVISCDHVFFHSALNHQDNMDCSVLIASEDVKIPFLSVLRIPLKVCSARGRKLLPGSIAVSGQALIGLGSGTSCSRLTSREGYSLWW